MEKKISLEQLEKIILEELQKEGLRDQIWSRLAGRWGKTKAIGKNIAGAGKFASDVVRGKKPAPFKASNPEDVRRAIVVQKMVEAYQSKLQKLMAEFEKDQNALVRSDPEFFDNLDLDSVGDHLKSAVEGLAFISREVSNTASRTQEPKKIETQEEEK